MNTSRKKNIIGVAIEDVDAVRISLLWCVGGVSFMNCKSVVLV